MSGRQEGRARSSRAYAHDRTEHGRHSRTLRASVPDLSHVPRKRAGRPREVLRRVRLSPTGIGDASEPPHRAITLRTLPERSAEPRAQREWTLPICHSPAGRTSIVVPSDRFRRCGTPWLGAQRGEMGFSMSQNASSLELLSQLRVQFTRRLARAMGATPCHLAPFAAHTSPQ